MVTRTYQERFKTLQGVFDAFTQRNLFELESRRIYDELVMPIKVGKESNVFIAKRRESKGKENDGTERKGRESYVIVKIYRIQNCDFKRMFHYIKQDPRYDELRQHRREIIFSWVQREYKNLLKAAKAGVSVPKPLGWRAHILVEELIGDAKEGNPAQSIKDAPPKNPKEFAQKILVEIKKLYHAGLIHGDLSSFNILNNAEEPYFIDFSQGTITTTPNSHELLKRDIRNVSQFFGKLGLKIDEEKVFKEIVEPEKND